MSKQSVLPCPVCAQVDPLPFADIPSLPIACNVLWETAAEAKSAPRGEMTLNFCSTCGHIFNSLFDPQLMAYSQTYENSLHHSPRFQAYATRLVDDLIARYDIHSCDIVEIGAGQGDFLQMMCDAGNNRGVGFDPAFVAKEKPATNVDFVADYYGEKYANYPAEVILCRHVLEHIAEPAAFIGLVRRVIGGRRHRLTFFEVPNALWTLRQLGVWDLIYEHCGYFTPSSLRYLFLNKGLAINRLQTVFGGQFLTIEAEPTLPPNSLYESDLGEIELLKGDIGRFSTELNGQIDLWNNRIAGWQAENSTAVIWGAGSKGVTFLNMIATDGVIEYAVDINPRKKGMFISGTGQQIVHPDDLATIRPDHVVIMNPNYRDEIEEMLLARGVTAEIWNA